MDFYIGLHSLFSAWSAYYIVYCIQRIVRHWKDGKERVRTSGGRLVGKIALTISCAVLEFIHVADYVPSQYKQDHLILHSIYFTVGGISWLFSSALVYFDYTRRLKSQWRGQRIFWISKLLINIALLVFNVIDGIYDFDGDMLYQFDLIQIISYVISILICTVLSFYSVFLPDDFTVISDDLYIKLKRSALLFDDSETDLTKEEVMLRVSIAGYKIKQIQNTSYIQYNLNITVNNTNYKISRSVADFEALDQALREKFPKADFPNLEFPEFSPEVLRKCSTEERGNLLGKYLAFLCHDDFMTPDLLNFLQIEGAYRDILTHKHNLMLEERLLGAESIPRSESKLIDYYTPQSDIKNYIENPVTTRLMWVIQVSIPSYRYDESTQILDYYMKTEIQALGFDKLRPYKFADFCDLHKALKKTLQPGNIIAFPAKNYGQSFKTKDKLAIEARKEKLELYFSQILNDPAYLCKELLDFIGCDADLTQVLDLIPTFKYRLTEEMTWEGDISDDSTHYILYCIYIGKATSNSTYEVQWRISRRYREFDALHKILHQRHSNPALENYLRHCGKQAKPLPSLPSKTLSPLSTLEEIETRKSLLELYVKDLISNPSVICSFAFQEFINEKS